MEWQPIETAPKDQSLILVCESVGDPDDYGAGVCVALWTELHAGHKADDVYVWANWHEGMDDNDVWFTVNPTHWMPLPNAPA